MRASPPCGQLLYVFSPFFFLSLFLAPVSLLPRVADLILSFHAIHEEEFGIYLNYVRKLGFEEAPDYDFLRELFAKVMKNNGDADDQVYDWNLLNGACAHPYYPLLRLCSVLFSFHPN